MAVQSVPSVVDGAVDSACSATRFVREEFETIVNNALLFFDAATELLDGVQQIVDEIPGAGWIADLLLLGLQLAADATSAVVRGGLTTEFWDDVQCALYCLIDGPDEIPGAWAEWGDAVDALGTPSSQFTAMMIRAYGAVDWMAWRSAYSNPSEVCGFCGCATPGDIQLISWVDSQHLVRLPDTPDGWSVYQLTSDNCNAYSQSVVGFEVSDTADGAMMEVMGATSTGAPYTRIDVSDGGYAWVTRGTEDSALIGATTHEVLYVTSGCRAFTVTVTVRFV